MEAKRKKLYIWMSIFIFFPILLHSFSKSYTFVGNVTITNINQLQDGKVEVTLTNLDIGTESVKVNEKNTIVYRDKDSTYDDISSKKLLKVLSTNEEYYIRIDIYKFPLDLVLKNKIKYLQEI
ncbi:hypothetical protein AB685_18860 [Bacillus sp. LL01]|uniref:hypothetical protein n=1 Tax=Bacillus sp. LL01 TaxID=1665556 RepID=UPI00064CF7FA|nr:hypothetical protein [Bacillus sp. LL01]KMJ57059.1 hypothetical protein AB685_18860 [Bacillus sp. LL01]